MVKAASFDRHGMKKGAWSEDEDNKLRDFVVTYGHWNWRLLPKYAGLKRCGKSCRLRWVNHLKPGVKRGNFSKEEEELIIKLHAKIGNKWSAIAMELPGRTDNDIKNFWHTRLARRRRQRPTPAATASDDQLKAASSSSMEEMGQYSSLDPTSLIKTHHHRYSAIQTQPQNDDASSSSNLDKFCYPQLLHHSSQNMINALDWIIPEEDRPTFFWDESYAFMNTSDFNPLEEEQGAIYDPLFCLWDS